MGFIKPGNNEHIMRLLEETYKGESALDLAGEFGCVKAAIVLIRFFERHFRDVVNIFEQLPSNEDKSHLSSIQTLQEGMKDFCGAMDRGEYDFGAYRIVYAKFKGVLNDDQKKLVKIYYWAGWCGERNMVYLFLKGLCISPFAKAYRGCSVVTACVIGHQIDLL